MPFIIHLKIFMKKILIDGDFILFIFLSYFHLCDKTVYLHLIIFLLIFYKALSIKIHFNEF